MEFKRRWLGYDREEVKRLINQTNDANTAANDSSRQLLSTLNAETEQLEAELQLMQTRVEKSAARAQRLQESNYIVDMVFAILKDSLVMQRGDILQIAAQMAEELTQRCNELQTEANDMDLTIGMMQKQIEEKLQLYQRILSGNSQEMARINDKYPRLIRAQSALQGKIAVEEALATPPADEKPGLQLVKDNWNQSQAGASDTPANASDTPASTGDIPAGASDMPDSAGAQPNTTATAAAADAPEAQAPEADVPEALAPEAETPDTLNPVAVAAQKAAAAALNAGLQDQALRPGSRWGGPLTGALAAAGVETESSPGNTPQPPSILEEKLNSPGLVTDMTVAAEIPQGIGEESAGLVPGLLSVPEFMMESSQPAVAFADGSWHALIIDDDSTVLAMLRAIFEREGAYVTEAIDGNVANALLNEIAPPDIVILDLMLPYVDGFQLLMRMRSKPGWNKVPVVILSSRTSEQEAVKLLQAGASDYLTKPFNTKELMTRARMAMNRDPLAMHA